MYLTEIDEENNNFVGKSYKNCLSKEDWSGKN